MTNREKFKDELVELHYVAFDKRDNKLKHCRKLSCRDCLFNAIGLDCKDNYKKWLNKEYIDPKKQPTTRDIEIMKACKEIFGLVYFTQDNDNDFFAFDYRPYKCADGIWRSAGSSKQLKVNLSHISWEDEEPYRFEGE